MTTRTFTLNVVNSGGWPLQGDVSYTPIVRNGRGPGMNTGAGSGRTTGTKYAPAVTPAGYNANLPITQIRRVTNLNDQGTGSLRQALIDHNGGTGPSTVVFEVSGQIPCNPESYLNITRSGISIYGQTAPAPGIEIIRGGLFVQTSDVLVQHMSFSRGPYDPSITAPADAVSIAPHNSPETPITGIVLDHCSMAWAMDECVEIVYSTARVTISNCIIAESFCDGDGRGGMSTTKGYSDDEELLLFGNLWVSSGMFGRNPLGTKPKFAQVNNYIYNHQFAGTYLQVQYGTSPTYNSIVGNNYRRGPSTQAAGTDHLRPGDAGYGPMSTGSLIRFEGCSGAIVGTTTFVTPSTNIASQWQLARGIEQVNGNYNYTEAMKATSRPYWPEGLIELPQTSDASVLLLRQTIATFVGPRPRERYLKQGTYNSLVDRWVTEACSNGALSGSPNTTGSGGSHKYANPANGPSVSYQTLASASRSFTAPTNYHYIGMSGYTLLEEQIHALEDGVQ